MKPKTTIYTLLLLCMWLWESPVWAQSAKTPAATLASWEAEQPQSTVSATNYRSASNARYVLLQGQILGGDEQPVSSFHLDVYEIQPDGKRTLIRTGPYPGNQYQLHLESGASYELTVQANGYEVRQFEVQASETHPNPVAIRLRPRPRAAVPALSPIEYSVSPENEYRYLPDYKPLPEFIAAVPVQYDVAVPVALSYRNGTVAAGTPLLRGLTGEDEPLLQLPADAEVEILERTTAEWWMVAYHGEMGWVRSAMIK